MKFWILYHRRCANNIADKFQFVFLLIDQMELSRFFFSFNGLISILDNIDS